MRPEEIVWSMRVPAPPRLPLPDPSMGRGCDQWHTREGLGPCRYRYVYRGLDFTAICVVNEQRRERAA